MTSDGHSRVGNAEAGGAQRELGRRLCQGGTQGPPWGSDSRVWSLLGGTSSSLNLGLHSFSCHQSSGSRIIHSVLLALLGQELLPVPAVPSVLTWKLNCPSLSPYR